MLSAELRQLFVVSIACGLLEACSFGSPARAQSDAGAEPMPEGLEIPGSDPFTSGVLLQAHKLRGLTAEVAGLVLQSAPGGDIAVEALAVPLRPQGDRVYVPVLVEIDGATFLNTNQATTARVEVYAYALGPEQDVAGYLAEAFAVDVQGLGEAIWQSGLKYYGHLELPAGEYRLRVLVRNYHSRAAAVRESRLTVPAVGDFAKPLVLAPLFSAPESRDAWLPVLEWGGGETYGADYPFMAGDRALRPVALPVLTAGHSATAHLFAYRLPPGNLDGRVELIAVDGSRTSADLRSVTRKAPDNPEAGIPGAVEVAFEVPNLEPGSYGLRVDLGEGRTKASSPAVDAVVLKSRIREAVLWTDLRGQLNTSEVQEKAQEIAETATGNERQRRLARERAEKGRRRAEEEELGRLGRRYREVLKRLALDDAAAARSELLDLESEVLTASGGNTDALRKAQIQVAEQLAASELEALIPLLVLHEELYLIYRQRRLYSLSFHARSMIEELAELYAFRGASQGSAVVAARALVSLGGYLQEVNLPASSREIFTRALEHDPLNKTAMLGLATSYERYGEYAKAVDVLEQLAIAHPDLAESQLRLAIDLKRLGIHARARQLLRRVVELDAPDWIRSLAHQELARSLLETGAVDDAITVLERSLELAPEQSAQVMLAHAYDRQRQPRRSSEILDRVAAAPRRTSARKSYDSWPEASLREEREALAEAAALRVPLVAELLGGGPEREVDGR